MIWEETMTLQELSEHYQLRAQLEKDEDMLRVELEDVDE